MSPALPDGLSLSRRAVLTALSGSGLSYVGGYELLSWVRISEAGADPNEYVPENCGEETAELVLTTGPGGEPDQTEEAPAETKRRLEVYADLPVEEVEAEYDGPDEIEGVDLERRSDNTCDLALVFSVKRLGRDHPTAIDGVPVVYEYHIGGRSGEDYVPG